MTLKNKSLMMTAFLSAVFLASPGISDLFENTAGLLYNCNSWSKMSCIIFYKKKQFVSISIVELAF